MSDFGKNSVSEEGDRNASLLQRVESVMGVFPGGKTRCDLRIRRGDRTKFSGYERVHLTFDSQPDDPVCAWLLLPEKPRGSGIVALHPTSLLGKDIVVGFDEQTNWNYGSELAQRGHTVIALDYPGSGEPQRDPYEAGYVSTTMKGIWNHSRALDVLTGLDGVDPLRLGVIGQSLGGHNAVFLAFFDHRIRALVSSCGITAFSRYQGGDIDVWGLPHYMPRVRSVFGSDPARMPFDFADLLASIVPRGIFISAPTGDENFDLQGVTECVQAARQACLEKECAQENIVLIHPECGHDFPLEVRGASYAFLEDQLSSPICKVAQAWKTDPPADRATEAFSALIQKNS